MAERFSKKQGFWAAVLAYGLWGILPIYWKLLSSVSSLQILAHRIVWAAVFCLILLLSTKSMKSLRAALSSKRMVLLVIGAALIVTINWGIYIYAVTSNHVIESALGYYINPLLSVAFGGLFFHEKIDKWTGLAVGIATAGIVLAAILYARVPWISLLLALTFALYGAAKKSLNLSPITSLALETFIVTPLMLLFLVVVHSRGAGAFINKGFEISALLMLAGVVTAIPLLLFGVAATSISLQALGFIQYFSPTLQLLIGLFLFNEKPDKAVVVAFVAVLMAVVIYVVTRIRGLSKS